MLESFEVSATATKKFRHVAADAVAIMRTSGASLVIIRGHKDGETTSVVIAATDKTTAEKLIALANAEDIDKPAAESGPNQEDEK